MSVPVDADLAALLDDEVSAIETGKENGRVPSGDIDIPPDGRDAQPVDARPVAAGHAAPVPQRIGAIMVEPGGKAGMRRVDGRASLALGRSALPDGPGGSVDVVPLQLVKRTDEEKVTILARIDGDWMRSLHAEIDDLYKQVVTEFNSPPENAERALSMLREARQILIETPEEYVSAEYRARQVRAMVDRTLGSRRASAFYGPRLLGYELGWLLLFLAGLILSTPLANWITEIGNLASSAGAANVLPLFSSIMWGGIGGVVGGLYHLWWHVAERQDFDRQYLMWYLVQPVMGMVLGGILFLALSSGLLVFQIDLTSANVSTAARILPYLLAVLGGFRQNFVYELFDRLVGLFTPASKS